MAKEAPKGKENAAKETQKKADKPVAPKAAKATAKPAAAKPSGKAAQTAGKVAAKKASAKGGKKKVGRGDQYSCEVCGLVVSVDEVCGCAEAHNIICCGQEMKAGK
jgi:hypothetical protein